MSSESNLNFLPQYEQLLTAKRKLTTLRLGDASERFRVGQRVLLTVGWDQSSGKRVGTAVIQELMVKPLKEITNRDLEGESPDCDSLDAIKYVLSSIYRTVVSENDNVSIIKWKYE